MDRRSFVKDSGLGLILISAGSGALLMNACKPETAAMYNNTLLLSEVEILNELGEIILPTTDTPGAKAAQVGEFIALILEDCYEEEDQVAFRFYLEEMDDRCRESYGKIFLRCSDLEREELVSQMEKENHQGYKEVKDNIVSAYLSSEIGTTEFFTYYGVPGRYDGCISERPW